MTRRRRCTPSLLDALPPLPDEAVVALAEFLSELHLRFETMYYGQIRRYYAQQPHGPDDIEPPAPLAPADDSDPPF